MTRSLYVCKLKPGDSLKTLHHRQLERKWWMNLSCQCQTWIRFVLFCFSFTFSWSTVVYNALVSGTQQSESAIHTHIHSFLDSFPKQVITEYWVEWFVQFSRSLQYQLSILYIVVWICQSHSPNLSLPPYPLLPGKYKSVLYISFKHNYEKYYTVQFTHGFYYDR